MLGWGLNLGLGGGSVTAPAEVGDAMATALASLDVFFDIGTLGGAGMAAWFDADMGFGESVTIGATTLEGLFDDESFEGAERGGPRVRLKTSDVVAQSIEQGSVLTIRARTFHVAGVQRDGVGTSLLILHEPL